MSKLINLFGIFKPRIWFKKGCEVIKFCLENFFCKKKGQTGRNGCCFEEDEKAFLFAKKSLRANQELNLVEKLSLLTKEPGLGINN